MNQNQVLRNYNFNTSSQLLADWNVEALSPIELLFDNA